MKEKGFFKIILGLLITMVLVGLYITFTVFTQGQGSLFHSDDSMPWTLLIASYVFFVLTSTGATLIAAMPTIFGMEKYEPLVKRAIFIALAALIAGFISIGMEMGSPLNMYNYLLSPNFNSPIWWMGLFYSSLLVVLLLKFYRIHTGKPAGKFLSIIAFVLEIAALSTLGSVFGLIEARPTFFGEYIQVYFLFSALLCGLAVLIFFNVLFYKINGTKMPENMLAIIQDLGKIMAVVISLALLLTIWRATTTLYSVRQTFIGVQNLIDSWPYRFEIFFGLMLPLCMLMYTKLRENRRVLFAISFMVLFGMGIGRMDLVMAGQLLSVLPKPPGEAAAMFYFPTIWEWFAGLFALSFMFLLVHFGERYIGLDEMEKHTQKS
jgi:molybdopterin-containing oxidoreductase family membrane subunit